MMFYDVFYFFMMCILRFDVFFIVPDNEKLFKCYLDEALVQQQFDVNDASDLQMCAEACRESSVGMHHMKNTYIKIRSETIFEIGLRSQTFLLVKQLGASLYSD